jgi:hypothetical protein
MADQRLIDQFRSIYKNYSRDQLIGVMHSKIDSCEEHIAAKQCLVEMGEYEQYERRILDIGRESNYALWNALLTLDGIIFSVFSAVAVFSQTAKGWIFTIVAISMLSAVLLILNFRSLRNKYRLIGQALAQGVENLSPEQRKQQITASNREYEWCNYRETATHCVLGVQGILILILICIRR